MMVVIMVTRRRMLLAAYSHRRHCRIDKHSPNQTSSTGTA